MNDLANLYDTHGAAIYRYLLTVLGRREAAEDALQEVWVRLHRRLQRPLFGLRNPQAYLWRTARNEARRALSKRGRQDQQRRDVEEEGWRMFPDESHPGISREDRLTLARELARLPIRQREAVALMAFEGHTAAEAGEHLGISANTVASRYRLALERLRRRLVPDREET